jgi:hypothetical protein
MTICISVCKRRVENLWKVNISVITMGDRRLVLYPISSAAAADQQ